MTTTGPHHHPHLNLTHDQLDALRDTTRALIDSAFGGDRKAYFDTVGPTGYVLTSTGWTTSRDPEALFDDPRCAITDHELIIDADDDKRDDDDTPFKYADDAGIWVAEYATTDASRINPQIGPDPHDRTAPDAGAEPVLVTMSFSTAASMLWPECWWFDRRTAVPVVTARLECDHRVPYEDEGARLNPELAVWRTGDGRWVAQFTDPAELKLHNPDPELWCALDERYVAHLLYCTAPKHINRAARDLPLVQLVTVLRRAVDELVLPTGYVFLDSDNEGQAPHPSHYHSTQALRALTAVVTGFIAATHL